MLVSIPFELSGERAPCGTDLDQEVVAGACLFDRSLSRCVQLGDHPAQSVAGLQAIQNGKGVVRPRVRVPPGVTDPNPFDDLLGPG